MKKHTKSTKVLALLAMGLMAGSVMADGGGSSGPDPVKHRIQHFAPYDTNCGEGIPPTSGGFMRKFNLKVYYQGVQECNIDIYGNANWRTSECNSTVHDNGHMHTYELRHTVDRHGHQWSSNVHTVTRNGDPRKVEVTKYCGLTISS